MKTAISLFDSKLTELILSHLENSSINQLLNKAPMKRRISVLPSGASNSMRTKAIDELASGKNINYVLTAFENGQFNGLINEKYSKETDVLNEEQLKRRLNSLKGEGLEYLLFVISTHGREALEKMFNSNPESIDIFSSYLQELGIDDYKLRRQEEYLPKNEDGDYAEVRRLEEQYQKLQGEFTKFQKKSERDNKKERVQIEEKYRSELETISSRHQIEIKEIRRQLLDNENIIQNLNKEIEKITKKNNKLEAENRALQDNVHLKKRMPVLIIGNLPEQSILDETRYEISARPDLTNMDTLIANENFVKVYLQSEYVSTSEYYSLKKKFVDVTFEYTSRANMG